MQDEHIVRDLVVSNGSRIIKASYFVESGVVHASIGDKTYRLSVGGDSSEEAVRRLVVGQMHYRTWRERMIDRWQGR